MTKKWTAKTAAIEVLEEAREPMSIMEICEGAIKLGWSSKGKTPEGTIASCLYMNAGDGGPFVQIESGVFGLRKYKKRYKQDIFYVLKNEAMPNYFKMGITSGLKKRISILSNRTAVPLPFKHLYAVKSKKAADFERRIKNILSDYREGKTEFFKGIKVEQHIKQFTNSHAKDIEKEINEDDDVSSLDSEKALSTKASPSPKSVTITSQSANTKPKKIGYTGPFNFREVNIPTGSTLTLKGNPSVTCEVYDDTQVKYRGEVMSVSRAATLAKESSTALAGTLYWEHRGKTLRAIQDEMGPKPSVASSPKETKYTGPFNFREIGIPRGAILTFIKDASVTCEVHNDTQVRFRGNVMSLSKAAGLAKGIARELWGPKFWQYEGELLFSRRERIRQTK